MPDLDELLRRYGAGMARQTPGHSWKDRTRLAMEQAARPRRSALPLRIVAALLLVLCVGGGAWTVFLTVAKPGQAIPPALETPSQPPESSAPPTVSPFLTAPSTTPSPEPEPTLSRRENVWTFLLAASDQVSGNSDTIMVARYDADAQTVGLVSIPRDTFIPEQPYRINSTYQNGVESLRDTVSRMLGIPIDYYITIDVSGFVQLVDCVGGIDFDIPVYMSYDDPVQDLHIHFSAGMTHLDGQAAMEVCRFRHNNTWDRQVAYSDVERTQTQQAVLSLIAQKVLANPQKLLEYVELFHTYVKTDLSLSDCLWLAQSAAGMDPETDLSSATLPGDGTASYRGYTWLYELDPDETLRIVNELLNPYDGPMTAGLLDVAQVP